MTKRRSRRKRVPKVLKEEVEAEVLVAEDVEEEVVEEAPKRRRRGPRIQKEVDVVVKPKRRRRVRPAEVEVAGKPVVAPVGVLETDDEDLPAEVDVHVSGDELLSRILQVVDAGKPIIIHKVGKGYHVSSDPALVKDAQSAKRVRIRTKKEMEDIALTDEYKEWKGWWKPLTFEEKVAAAKEDNVVWDECEDPQANALRLAMAYRAEMDIAKWKDEYSTTNQRNELIYG